MTGWEALPFVRWILLVIAAAPLILTLIVVVGGQTSWPRGELTAVLAILGLTIVVVRGFVVRPGQPPARSVSTSAGSGLAGTLIMLVAAARHRAASDTAGKKPPGVL